MGIVIYNDRKGVQQFLKQALTLLLQRERNSGGKESVRGVFGCDQLAHHQQEPS